MYKNPIIVFEGIEGSGKSFQCQKLYRNLKKANIFPILTREPGGTAIGEQIREILLKNENYTLTYDTELLLVFSARAQHIQEVILPALSSGKIILCDRFTDASYAYQGGGRGIDASRINLLEKWVQGDLRPNLTLLFDLDVNIGMQRSKKRSDADRFEREEINFFEKIRNTYLERAKNEPQRFRIINSASSLESVKEQIITILKDFLC